MNREEFRKNSKDFYINRKKQLEEDYKVDIYDAKEMGFIDNVEFGLRDIGHPCLSFTMTAKSGGSLQVLFYPEYEYFIYEYGVSNIKSLVNKPIWIFHQGGMMIYVEPYK